MRARDVMVSHVISVGPELDVKAVANTLVKNSISAVPVVGIDGKLLGIVSEGDLIRRVEVGTDRKRSRWLDLFASEQDLAAEFVKSHGRKAKDVMTAPAITASPDASLQEIATLLERHGIKRVPIVENGHLVGVVSRANIVQALASRAPVLPDITPADESLRDIITETLRRQLWSHGAFNVIVERGVVSLWGFVESEDEKKAIRVAAETTPGVIAVNDNLRVQYFVTGI